MRKVHLVLRLFFAANMGIRAIARAVEASPATIGDYVRRARVAGLGWPLPETLNEAALEALLFPPTRATQVMRPLPAWSHIHRELRRKGVTLALLWQEYKAEHPAGVQYSQFCVQYRAWAARVDAVMRQTHRAGEKLFVDYAGHPAHVIDRATGERREAQVFVAVLGASNYTYAEATWTQSLADWTASHVRALTFFGGVPELVVPDNLRAAVTVAHRYEPDLNPTYQALAAHYGMAIVPARVRKPRDKAKVEVGVQVVERWILAALRNREFFSLAELNAEIARLLERLNARSFRRLPGSRLSAFETLERPALRPLPAQRYEFAQWKKARVHLDYHVELERHYYSVPHALIGQELHVRYTAHTVECLYRGARVASHPRAYAPGHHTTLAAHMPERHQQLTQWSPERFRRWAAQSGPNTQVFIERVIKARRHPEQSYRACLGLLRLGKTYGEPRLDAACHRALALGTHRVRSVESILKHRLDEHAVPATQQTLDLPTTHDNLRGAHYYH